jgi:hypothetical protein
MSTLVPVRLTGLPSGVELFVAGIVPGTPHEYGGAEADRITIGDRRASYTERVIGGGTATAIAGKVEVSIDQVKAAIGAIAGQMHEAFKAVDPDKATVELALSFELDASGVATRIFVGDAKTDGSIKITLEWDKQHPAAATH